MSSSDQPAELLAALAKRKELRKRVTSIFNNRTDFDDLSPLEIYVQIQLLEKFNVSLRNVNDIIDAHSDGDTTEEEYTRRFDYENKIFTCISDLKFRSSETNNTAHTDTNGARTLLRSPVAPLPKFSSSEGEDLTRFLSEFEDTVSKYKYGEYDKLLLLKQQVSGRALILINSLESDKQGYTQAKELLQEALASTDVQINNTIKQFTDLKLDYRTDPFEFISKVKKLLENIDKLKISENHFVQFFVWRGLNDCFQEQLIQITNSIRPDLDTIMSKFFVASERYASIQKKSVPDNASSTSFAAKVNFNRSLPEHDKFSKTRSNIKCSLCLASKEVENNHYTYKCCTYKTPQSKIDLLNKLGGCTKCGYTNHKTESCRYKFSQKCRNCNGWHQTYLCLKNSSTNQMHVSNHMITITESLRSTVTNNSILPTFSCTINDYKIRGLKDCGSQTNFISERIANTLNLKVIDSSVSLTVNGINSTKSYQTRLVEFPVRFGMEEYVIEALCIPDININIALNNLGKVVHEFQLRGYKLADTFLNGDSYYIDNLDLILGTKSAHCLPETEIVIGLESVYSETHCGILLRGDVEQFLSDVENLPNLSEKPKTDRKFKFSSDCVSNESVISCLSSVSQYETLDDCGVIESELKNASEDILDKYCNIHLNYDPPSEDKDSVLNNQLAEFALDNIKTNTEGRIVLPLLWNNSVSHLLGNNKNLSISILKSNLNKLSKQPELLKLMDQTFKDQIASGIIEEIHDIELFERDNPAHSYLPHMGVFKLNRDTTKCRIVYLSNLCGKEKSRKMTVSHNQAIHCGPSLNQKLSAALLHLKFDQNILCFDIAKAFNCLALNEEDQNRLCLLWFRNVDQGDFSLVPYKHARLSFGLRCSPALLMLALFWMLVVNVENDSEELKYLKSLIYQLSYMDNLAVSANNQNDLVKYYECLENIFKPYGFPLQQFITNDSQLQDLINRKFGETPSDVVKLLGLEWNRVHDYLSTKPINLDKNAKTKRSILSTIASQFDLLNYNAPLMNRAKLFLHSLQCDDGVSWDSVIDSSKLREWRNIVKQVNAAPPIKITRFVGRRDGTFRLLGFSDSSKTIYGTVIFIQDTETNQVNFLMSKSKIANKTLETKSIPSLEMQGIVLATECLIDIRKDLSGSDCVVPVDIKEMVVYTDSLVCLSWINSCVNKLDKLQKYSVFIQNRLHRLIELANVFPVSFKFISGCDNPADCVTRCLSYKQLTKTNYVSGPEFLKSSEVEQSRDEIFTVNVPNPNIDCSDVIVDSNVGYSSFDELSFTSNLDNSSSYRKLRNIYSLCFQFINKLKIKLHAKDSIKFNHLRLKDENYNYINEASEFLLLRDQSKHYSEIVSYFNSHPKTNKDIPHLVKRLNIYMDKKGLLRVKSKFGKMKDNKLAIFPILLSKDSRLTDLIVVETHKAMMHAGTYSILNEIRLKYWIPHCFSVIKRNLKLCVRCRRFNARPVKLNQSDYRENRINPSQIPFRNLYIDYIGPYLVKLNGENKKVYLLCFTCMFSRAINLKLSLDLSVTEFLRSFQMHCFEFGLPSHVVSDLGTQLVAGSNIITDFLKDNESQKYFEENGVESITFEQYYKGRSELGSLVESCVKLIKRLIYGAIRNNVLNYRDFEFLIAQTIHLVNKRPVAFKESLRDCSGDEFPCAITPENLLRGYDLISLNVVPDLQPNVDGDSDWNVPDNIRNNFESLKRVRSSLIELYHKDFLVRLIEQAVSVKDRYKPVFHKSLNIGDIVILKEPNTKMNHYPMGLVKALQTNDLGEVTGATVLKGSSRELVKRHSSTIIPLLTSDEDLKSPIDQIVVSSDPSSITRRARASALQSRILTRQMLNC